MFALIDLLWKMFEGREKTVESFGFWWEKFKAVFRKTLKPPEPPADGGFGVGDGSIIANAPRGVFLDSEYGER